MEPITAAFFFVMAFAIGEENRKQDEFILNQQTEIKDLEDDLYATDESLYSLVGSHASAVAALKMENEHLRMRVKSLESAYGYLEGKVELFHP
jgi:hypothetical protein